MILVDSSVWIDYFRGTRSIETALLDRLLGETLVGIGDLMIAEVLQGFDTERQFRQAERMMSSLAVVDLGGRDVAVEAARNLRRLRHRGVTVRKTIDCVIATRCLVSQHELLHCDRDFDPFETHLGLLVRR